MGHPGRQIKYSRGKSSGCRRRLHQLWSGRENCPYGVNAHPPDVSQPNVFPHHFLATGKCASCWYGRRYVDCCSSRPRNRQDQIIAFKRPSEYNQLCWSYLSWPAVCVGNLPRRATSSGRHEFPAQGAGLGTAPADFGRTRTGSMAESCRRRAIRPAIVRERRPRVILQPSHR